MGKRFDPTKVDRKLVEAAMARLDANRTAKRRAAWRAGTEKAKRRFGERKAVAARERKAGRGGGRPMTEPKLALPGWQVLAARMDTGTWYTFGELRALIPEFARGSAKAWIMGRLQADGMIERAGNPDFDPAGGSVNPGRYLYALTADGARSAESWRSVLGE